MIQSQLINLDEKRDFEVNSSNLKNVRLFCREVFEKLNINQELKDELVLAIAEAAQNIVKHAYNNEQTDDKMEIKIIPCLSDNYSYLIFEKETNTLSIVDPSDFHACDEIIKKYKKLDYILNTHHHADHVDGNIKLKNKYNCKNY